MSARATEETLEQFHAFHGGTLPTSSTRWLSGSESAIWGTLQATGAQRTAVLSLGTQVTTFQVNSATGSAVAYNSGQEVQVTHSVPAGNGPSYSTRGTVVLNLDDGAGTAMAEFGDALPSGVSISPSPIWAGYGTEVAVNHDACGRMQSVRAAFLLLAMIFAAATASQAQQTLNTMGVVRGTVFDEQNQPLDGATVTLDLVDDRPSQRIRPMEDTDSQGKFVIDHVRWGKYRIGVGKEEAGYPDTIWQIYSGGVNPTVVISPDHPEASVALSVGPKAGVLAVVVLDASTGQPIDSLRLGGAIWIWPDDHNDRLAGTIIHKNRLLVPPFLAVGVEIDADGYQRERYPEKILLAPGEEMTIKVNLWPAPKKP